MRDKPPKKDQSKETKMRKREGQERIMQEIWLLGEWTYLLINFEWSYTTVLWESKELIPFDIEFFPFISLKYGVSQR